MPISNIFIPKILNRIRMLDMYSEDDIDMMRYSLQAIMWEIEKLVILGIVFAVFQRFDYFLVTLIVLISIRIQAGGYHSKSSLYCLIFTFCMFALAIFVLPIIQINEINMYVILAVCMLVTVLIAPVFSAEREHLLLGKEKRGKVLSIVITAFWIIMILLFRYHTYAVPVFWMIVLQNMQMIFEYVRRMKNRSTGAI